jgi:putative aldouronate transport system substrate-binding protein
MKRNRTKILVGLLTCGVFLTACGGNNEAETAKSEVKLGEVGEFPVTEEKIQMTMMGPNTGAAEWKDMPFFHEMEELTNIEFSFNTPPTADFSTKLNLAFAGNDLPDVYRSKFINASNGNGLWFTRNFTTIRRVN